jgi:hypothetical protein
MILRDEEQLAIASHALNPVTPFVPLSYSP